MNNTIKILKATDVVGLPVITIDSGAEIDHVSDVLYDLVNNKVTALLIDRGGWFSEAKVIDLSDIHSIGHDVVLVPTDGVVKKAGDFKENHLAQVAKDRDYLRKTRMVTEEGEEIGKVTDVFFTLPYGDVTHFEVSEGLLEDAMEGRKIVPVANIITVGEDATIVRTGVEEDVDNQITGGVKQAVKELKQDAQIAVDKAEHQTRQLTDEAQSAVAQLKDKAKDEVKTDVVGKYLTKNIISDNDKVIGERGEMITHEMLHQAEANKVETELYKYSTSRPIND
jgi:uncharacterized protein YrrD